MKMYKTIFSYNFHNSNDSTKRNPQVAGTLQVALWIS
jgi:hypothetical protein